MNTNTQRLSEVTGLSKDELAGIWADVRLNGAKLDTCEGPHLFDRPLDADRPLFGRWRCARCSGVVDALAKQWYERGLKHAELGRLSLPVRS